MYTCIIKKHINARFLILACILAIFGCYEQIIKKETHYIPHGYIGQVVIKFEMKSGEKKEFYHGARVYKIPMSGILETKFDPNPGWNSQDSTFKFIYINTITGEEKFLTRIDWYSEQQKRDLDSNSIVVAQLGYVKRYYGGNRNIPSLTYYVDTLKNFDTYRPD